MAVTKEGVINRYIGLSTDAKPMPVKKSHTLDPDAVPMPAGSSFLESDTGKIFRWDGETWKRPEDADNSGVLLLILAELKSLNDRFTLFTK